MIITLNIIKNTKNYQKFQQIIVRVPSDLNFTDEKVKNMMSGNIAAMQGLMKVNCLYS